MFGLFKKTPQKPNGPMVTRGQLVPRIKHQAFSLALERAGVPAEQRPVTTPLCGELLITYAFDLPDSFIMATPDLLEEARIAPADMGQLAIANLQRDLPQVSFSKQRECGLAQVGGDLEAALLLVDSVWGGIEPKMKGELLAAVPRRDRLVLCDSANAEGMGALRGLIGEFFDEHNDQHRLSKQLMVRRSGRWVLYEH